MQWLKVNRLCVLFIHPCVIYYSVWYKRLNVCSIALGTMHRMNERTDRNRKKKTKCLDDDDLTYSKLKMHTQNDNAHLIELLELLLVFQSIFFFFSLFSNGDRTIIQNHWLARRKQVKNYVDKYEMIKIVDNRYDRLTRLRILVWVGEERVRF